MSQKLFLSLLLDLYKVIIVYVEFLNKMKKILKKLINLFGYEINKSRGKINMRQSLQHLKENGYTPKLIVDVGIADVHLRFMKFSRNQNFY